MRRAKRTAAAPIIEEHFRPAQLAERLGLSAKTILRACERGKQTGGREGLYPWRKLGRAIIIPASAVDSWLEGATG